MTITIDVPDNLVRDAAACGLSVESYIQEQFRALTVAEYERRGFTRFGDGTEPIGEVISRMLERRKKYPLGDFTIKQLIEEGRREL